MISRNGGDREREQKTNDGTQNGTLSDRENLTVAKNGKKPKFLSTLASHQTSQNSLRLWAYKEALS